MPTITGTTGPNILSGDTEWREDLGQFVTAPTVDEIFGLAGDDIIDGYFLGDTLWGDEGDDIVRGGDGNDSLTGLAGNDIFGGGGGDDLISGAGGNDTLYGGEGDDTITGGTGQDWIDGQTGIDIAIYAGSFAEYSFSPQADRLRVSSKAGDTDQLFGIERLRFDDGTVVVRPDFNIDSTAFTFTATSLHQAEGTGGTTAYTFTVARSGAIGIPQSIGWSVAGIAGTGTVPATAADFAGSTRPAGTFSFAPGPTSATITVNVAADAAVELKERFGVTLSAPSSGAVLGSATAAEGIILNDNTSLAFTTANLSRAEGNAGTTAYSFTISRSGITTGSTTVNWSFAGGGVAGTVAAHAADFAGGLPPGGTLTFAPGQTARSITIPVLGDTNPDGGFNESFTLSLANASGGAAIIAAKATGTIREDDTITGGPGNDTLFGTVGADLFVIGQGQDTIWGGNGVDSFRFLPSAAAPANLFTLNDFDPFVAERIDLSRIDAIAGTLANDAFTFIGPMPLTLPGQLHWERLSPHLVEFQGNLNADPAPELRIVLFSPGTPDSTWFVL